MRGLVCVVLAFAFGLSNLGSLGSPIEHSTHDCASVAGDGTPTNCRGSKNPRLVERVVGGDHLAINAAVPDNIVEQSPGQPLRLFEAWPIVLRLDQDLSAGSVRGPPVVFTL